MDQLRVVPDMSLTNTPTFLECKECKREFTKLLKSGICGECCENQKQKERVEAYLLETLGGSKAVKEFTFGGFRESAKTASAKSICEAFNPNTQNLYLYGPCGVGKTHLATAAIRKWVNTERLNYLGFPIRNCEVKKIGDLISQFRKIDSKEEACLIRYYSSIDILMIDDLGTEKMWDSTQDILYRIIDRRMMTEKNGLVITSNLSISDLAQKIENDRIISRLVEMCKIVKIDGEDHRLKKRAL